MSEGSDGAGGVGNDSGSQGAAEAASAANDALGAAANAVGAAVDAAMDALGTAIGDALGATTGALGLDQALGGLADALGLDAQDLQGIVGAAVVGMLSGGLPGAAMGVVNGLVGGSLTTTAREAIADHLPAEMQGLANIALDQFAGRIPGASVSIQEALTDIATGALTRGRTPDSLDIGAIARSLTDMRSAAQSVADSLVNGGFTDAVDAATAIDHVLGGRLAQARDIAASVTATLAHGEPAYASGVHDHFGNAVEQLAIDVGRVLASRG